MEPLRIGLVGLGRWGRNYVKTLLALPDCRLVAVADVDSATYAAVRGQAGIAVYESLARLLSDLAIEAVVVATPDRTHYALSAAALAAGRDVLVEKPMTLAESEAEALVRQAEDNNRVLAVGHTGVYSADIESLRVRLDALPRFAARRVMAERTSSGPSSAHSSFASRHSAILYDLCPHDIAIAVLLFGAPAAARARSNGKAAEYEVRFERNGLLNGRVEWREPPHVRRFEVAGAQKALSDGTGSPESGDASETPLGRQCLDFIECCRTRRQPLSNGRVGIAVMRCISALASSCADSGTWVRLRPEMRAPCCLTGAAEDDAERRIPGSGLRHPEFGVRT